MADIEHSEIGPGEVHAPHNWRVANAAARLALSVTSGDVGKYVWQFDDGSEWKVASTGPTVWSRVGGVPGGVVASVTGAGAISVDSTDPANPVVSATGTTLADYGIEDAAPLSHVGSGGAAHANVVAGGASGFMTGADKTKLNGIATGANNYVLPAATGGALGGVIVGTGLAVDGSGVLSATGGGGGGTVDSVVAGTAVSVDATDPANPVVSVTAATTGAPGSMSAADKAKLDGVATGATANVGTVTNVTGAGAISVATGSTTPAISIAAATGSVPGTMSAADKSKLDGVAAGATANVGTVTNVTGSGAISVATGSTTPAISVATASGSVPGTMSAADFTKLAGVASGATANSTDAFLLDRTNHTGTQVASTISNFAAAALAIVLTGLSLATGTAVISTDSILVAIGKLQKQITDLTTTVAGKMTNPMTTAGDIIFGGVSGAATRLGVSTNGFVLTLVAGAPAWVAAILPVGYGQTWQNMIGVGTRALGVQQTNSSGRAICAKVSAYTTTSALLTMLVDGVEIDVTQPPANTNGSAGGIVPAGSTYEFRISGGTPTLYRWAELRV